MTGPAAPEPGSLTFVDAHRPTLAAGTYEVVVTQPVTTVRPVVPLVPTVTETSTRTFSTAAGIHVLGPRLALQPTWIESRFPTASGGGQDSGVLPQVVLTRSTLPWERSALPPGSVPPGSSPPWLAVLLLTEDEAAGDATLPPAREAQVAVASLRGKTAAFPTLPDEPGPTAGDLVRVVDVPRGLLTDLLPRASWLGHLAHVRERFVGTVPGNLATDLNNGLLPEPLRALLRDHGRVVPDGPVRVEIPDMLWQVGEQDPLYVERSGADLTVNAEARAVVLSCRATVPDRRYRAYLVSLEGRYVRRPPAGVEPDDGEEFRIDWGSAAAAADLVRLVVLDRWDFAVGAAAGRLQHLLEHLSLAHGPTVPTEKLTGPGVAPLQTGYVLVGHQLRTGGSVRSWYRGPLVARHDQDFGFPPPEVADDVLLVDARTGILFTSFAAAWELGRMLTVADPPVSLDLVRWKSGYRRYLHRQTTADATPHLDGPRTEKPKVPSTVVAWVRRLLLLDGVPFGYLVPDPAMLPPESLRTFRLDPTWLGFLLQGAVAAGRLPGAGPGDEQDALTAALRDAGRDLAGPTDTVTVSGCLIRSEVVSGWPGVQVDGWTDAPARGGTRCPTVRRARLSDNVLLVLFHGELGQVDVHSNPEALHDGVELGDVGPGGRAWTLTLPDPGDGSGGVLTGTTLPRDVLPIAQLRASPPAPGLPPGPDLTAEAFARRLVAGAPKLAVTVPRE